VHLRRVDAGSRQVQDVDERLAVPAEVGQRERSEEPQRHVLGEAREPVVEEHQRLLDTAEVSQRAAELQQAAGNELVGQAEREGPLVVRDRLVLGPRVHAPRVSSVRPLESVPNFSEGRDLATIDAIGAALSAHSRLLDVHADEDHNRSVFTLVGQADELAEALTAAVTVARERIDLRTHEGAHPRVGAADVVPIVPLVPEDMPRAEQAAEAIAQRLAADCGVPVFIYAPPERGPAFFRRGGTAGLQARIDAGELAPDHGPARLHETAGAVLVGARRPLIAFNVNLRGELTVAREIARVVRERDGGFPGVRALGLDLRRAGVVQVSMNVEDWEAAALHEIVGRIEEEAAARGAEVIGSELVGLMPAGAAAAAAGALLRIDGFDASHVLELRLLDE